MDISDMTVTGPSTAPRANPPDPSLDGHQPPPLRVLVCGSVDDGKSTLIGRMMWDANAVKDDLAEAWTRDGKGSPDFALLVDGLQAEREQGITIDVAYRYFATDRRSFIIADTPGHAQYTRNMATGASTADLAVLLVDATGGMREQTRRHVTIAGLMGIRRFIVAVNKIDLVGHDRSVFDAIVGDVRRLCLSLGLTDITAVPVSALRGENVVAPAPSSMPWYAGPTLVESLEAAPAMAGRDTGFRFPVQRTCRSPAGFRGYQGTIAGGAVKPGDPVRVLPSGQSAIVERIVTYDLERNAAVAGDAVTLVLDRELDVARGDMLVAPQSPPMIGRDFTAGLVALHEDGVAAGRRLWLKSASRRQPVTVTPTQCLDLGRGLYRDADHLPLNGIGRVRLAFDAPAMFDPYGDNRATGAFVLIDPETLETVAGGTIAERCDSVRALAVSSASARKAASGRVVLSLPADLAEMVLALPQLAGRRDEVVVSAGPAREPS